MVNLKKPRIPCYHVAARGACIGACIGAALRSAVPRVARCASAGDPASIRWPLRWDVSVPTRRRALALTGRCPARTDDLRLVRAALWPTELSARGPRCSGPAESYSRRRTSVNCRSAAGVKLGCSMRMLNTRRHAPSPQRPAAIIHRHHPPPSRAATARFPSSWHSPCRQDILSRKRRRAARLPSGPLRRCAAREPTLDHVEFRLPPGASTAGRADSARPEWLRPLVPAARAACPPRLRSS